MKGSEVECLRWAFRDRYSSLKATTTQLSFDCTFADVVFLFSKLCICS